MSFFICQVWLMFYIINALLIIFFFYEILYEFQQFLIKNLFLGRLGPHNNATTYDALIPRESHTSAWGKYLAPIPLTSATGWRGHTHKPLQHVVSIFYNKFSGILRDKTIDDKLICIPDYKKNYIFCRLNYWLKSFNT